MHQFVHLILDSKTGQRVYTRNSRRVKKLIPAYGDCQNTRHEVLIAESLGPVKLNPSGCRVIAGQWHDPFTGQTFTDPSKLDIDHLVPLSEAHRSGASLWDAKKRERFANDLSHPEALIAVSASANRSKGDKDPANWLPPNKSYHCEYVASWVAVKESWGLMMDAAEEKHVRAILAACESR